VGQVVAVDGGVEDRPKKAQVAVDAGRFEARAGEVGLPGPHSVGVQGSEGEVAEEGENALFNGFAGLVGRVGVLRLPSRPPDLLHVVSEQGPRLGQVDVGRQNLKGREKPPLDLLADGLGGPRGVVDAG
jgi:hypothetical protein